MGRIKRSNVLLTCGLAFFGAAFAVGLGVAINSENNQTYEAAYAAWTGSGSGTSSDPYLIGTKAELEKFRDIVNGINGETQNLAACGKLTNDIDLEGDTDHQWTPIGNDTNMYTGTFDGDNHIVDGIFISEPTGNYKGLFGLAGNGVTLKNLTIKGKVIGNRAIGGLVGMISSIGSVSNCINYVNVTGGSDGLQYDGVGGLIGSVRPATNGTSFTINDCSNHGKVSATGNMVGGICGDLFTAALSMNKCFNTASITGNQFVGGIVGYNSNRGTISNVYNSGDITASNDVAGIIGINGNDVQAANTLVLSKCHNVGTVSATTTSGCYDGAILGSKMTSSISVSNAYYLGGSASQAGEGGGTSLTAAQMKEQSNFSGFDFTNVWEITNDSYPTFKTFDYIARAWDPTNKEVLSSTLTCTAPTIVTSSSTAWSNGWYVVNSDVTISSRVSVTGEVNLILCDGKTLTASQGIEVLTGNTLTIHGQSEDTGKVVVTAPTSKTGIGGSDSTNGGYINIHGGQIDATNYQEKWSAGIGGGSNRGFDGLSIYGGTIQATGSDSGPGIGSQPTGDYESGFVNIYGGIVIANGGENAAGIGGGSYRDNIPTINIYGGNITANGGQSGAGIGSGIASPGQNKDSGTINISGGTVTATGGSYGAGIGGGANRKGGTINISGGTVMATGTSGGAGIGGGSSSNGGNVTITGGHIVATGGTSSAGIGGGSNGAGGTVTISGGEIIATGASNAKGIGAGYNSAENGDLVVDGLQVLGNDDNVPTISDTKTDYSTTRWRYMKVGNYHTHNFTSYSANGNKITAICDNADGNCQLPEYKAILEISAPTGELTYDGSAKEAVTTDNSSDAAFTNVEITYTKGGAPITGSPVDAGTYVATVSCTEISETASIEYTINKADAVLTAPTAKTDLTYTGSAQELVNAGSTTGGNVLYSLDGENYSSSIPTATEAGNHTVYYKVDGGNNYNDIAPASLVVNIAEANATTLTDPTAIQGLANDGLTHELVNAGTTNDGTIKYKLEGGDYSEDIPTASETGAYIVYYKVFGDSNHNDTGDLGPIAVTINDIVASITSGETTTYYGTFDAALSNWNDGTTLKLYKDVTITSTITITNEQTLDLNGHGLKITSNNTTIFQVNNGGTLVLKDTNPTTEHKFTPPTGNAGLATLNEESGTLVVNGGYITGFKGNSNHAFYVDTGATFIMEGGNIIGNEGTGGSSVTITGHGHVIMDGGSIIYNKSAYWGAAMNLGNDTSLVTINGGNIAHNYSDQNTGAVFCWHLVITGGTITDNYSGDQQYGSYGAVTASHSAKISGNPIIRNNTNTIGYGDLSFYDNYLEIVGPLGDDAYIGIVKKTNDNVFTNTNGEYLSYNDVSKFHSDSGSYLVGKNAAGQLLLGTPYTVTYDAQGHGDTPSVQTVANGGLILEHSTLTAEGWDFGGWYKEDTCETLWDFANDTVTADTTLYAGWKNSYAITAPTAITGLKYTGNNQDLINAGSTEAGEMQYAVNTTGVLPADGDFTNTIPTGKLVNKYYVFYRTTGDADHYPVPASLERMVEITIARVDRTKVTDLNQEVIEFLDSIKDDERLDSVRAALEGVRNEVYNDAIVEDNIDEAGVEENYLKLKEAFDYHKQTVDAVKAIDDIGDLTYDGGIDDSQDDIIKAQSAYDALKPEQQEVVKNANKDVLDHDILVYKHVDKVGDLIKAIPEPSDSDDYYDAIDLAKAEFDKLTDEEKAVLNTDTKFDYEKALNDHRKAKEVIKTISKMDDVTYNGGTDDSLDEIKNAEEAYNGLTPDQKKIVDQANHDELEDKRESYDKVDDTVKKINNIGDIAHGGEKDSKKDIDEARKAYDSLTDEEKALVGGYNNSTQTLEDGEAVYEVMELIDSIGDIAYDTVPEKAIEEARQTYQSLTEAQKEKLGKEYYEVLVKSEEQYEEAKKTGDILLLVLMIILGLLLVAGLIFMFILLKKKKDDDDDNKKEPLKVASFSGLLPIIFLSHYLDAPYIVLYVIAALTVIVWTADIIIAVKKKGQKKAVTAQEVRKVEEAQPASEEEEEVVTVTDEKGNIFQIRFIKSFTAKLIQSPDETKKYYEELKNEVLSYKKTNSRVSWHYDSVNSGRNQVLKFAIRGKTLCVYYPLNADDYIDTKYKVEKSESKKYEEVPCMYRIKNERRLGYAKELIATVCESLGLVKGEEQHESYYLHYEENKPLIIRGLIKELKVQVNKPVEQPVPEPVNEDEDEVITLADEKGNIFQIRFVKSFTAKLIQSPDETKKYYEELKNYVLSYKKTTSRISWNYDSINSGRDQVLKFSIRGKTLCVYYPLNADDYAESKYKVEKVESKKFEEVPCLYRIKNDRRRDYAKDLIDTVMANLGLEKGEQQHEVYSNLPYEPNKPLIARGLIKELKVQVNKQSEPQVLETKTNADGDEVVITKDASGNIFEIRYIKSFTAKLSQSDDEVKDYYSELKNYALSYKKANSRVSWHYDSINVGRNQVLKFAIRGKTLCLYYALDADNYTDTKYKVEKVDSKKYEDVPCLYRIKNDRRRDYAKDLIDTVMANVGASKGEEQSEDYRIPYEETKVLLGKGLIKEVKTKVNKSEEVVQESISVTEVDQKMSDEVAEAKIIEDTTSKKHEGKKGIINIDTIGDNFSNGDVVDIEALWKKKLIPSNVGYVKVLARGSLNKRLTVDLQDYSIQAVKMILLSGGNVKKAK